MVLCFGYDSGDDFYFVLVCKEWMFFVMMFVMVEDYLMFESLKDVFLIVDSLIDFLLLFCDWNNWFKLIGIDYIFSCIIMFFNVDYVIEVVCIGVGVVLVCCFLMIKDVFDG